MAGSLRLSEDEARALIDRMNKNVGKPAPVVEKRALRLEPSRLEVMFAQQIAALELPAPVQQYPGAVPGRKYRLDFAWPQFRLAVEVQGMVHRIKGRFKADTEKLSLLVVHGWRVLPVSGDDVRSGRAAAWLSTIFEEDLPCSR